MKAKPVLIIIGSILIGIIVGFLISAQLRHRRMKPVRAMSSERYFRDVLYKVIEPSDELLNELDPILEKYGNEGRELQKDFRKSFEAFNDRYWGEIKAILSAEQIEKLEDYSNRPQGDRSQFRQDTSRAKGPGWEGRRGQSYGSKRGMEYKRDSHRIKRDTMLSEPDIH